MYQSYRYYCTQGKTLLPALMTTLILLIGSPATNAARVYVGLGFGPSWSTFDTTDVHRVAFIAKDLSAKSTIFKVLCGYQVSANFGIEAAYLAFLEKPRIAPTVYPPEGDQPYFETKMSGFEFTPIGTLPISKHFSVLARAGLIFWHSDLAFNDGVTGGKTESKSGSSLVVGLGVKYDFNKKFAARAEYAYYAIDKAKAGAGMSHVVMINVIRAF